MYEIAEISKIYLQTVACILFGPEKPFIETITLSTVLKFGLI